MAQEKKEIKMNKKQKELEIRNYLLDDLIDLFYNLPGNGAGGKLHILLDDFNVRDSDLEFCLDELKSSDSINKIVLGRCIIFLFSSFSPAQRKLYFENETVQDLIDVENKDVTLTNSGFKVHGEWNKEFGWLK